MAEDASEPDGPDDPGGSRLPTWVPRGPVAIYAALAVICAIIAVDVFVIVKKSKPGPVAPVAPVASVAPPRASSTPPPIAGALKPSEAEAFSDFEESSPSAGPAQPKAPEQRAVVGTVFDAAARSCSTSSVDGLSRQIIAQSRCIDPRAFVAVPRRPNLVTAPNVFLYLEASARDRLVRALDANKSKKMTVNSALRTVAQQYLLRRWARGRRCGIKIATAPGESNHETGLALDIVEAAEWRSALEAQNFRWLGAIDRVHFDYAGAASRARIDVKAFQQLWNRNHKDDRVLEDGRFTPETERRLEKSPARGFAQGPRCEGRRGT